MSYTLGILDQSPIIDGATNEQTLQKLSHWHRKRSS